MAHAYTPGLKVSKATVLKKQRILPLRGEVAVEVGQEVLPDDIVARTSLPGDATLVNVAGFLSISPEEVPDAMIKKVGEQVIKDEPIARSKSFFGLFKSTAKASMDGVVEDVNKVTGQVLLRGAPIPVEVRAYVRGKVVEVIPEEGCVVEAFGTFVQGIFGVGGETHGRIAMACDSPSQSLEESLIRPEHSGCILVGGNLVTVGALRKAASLGVKGVVAGGFHDKDLRELLGYDLGVAITGHENLGISLVITEGFGEINIAQNTFDVLKSHVGDEASINGATQIRAGVIRPEVIIPVKRTDDQAVVSDDEIHGLQIGSPIRIIRMPYFGRLGEVTDLPPELTKLESESKARILLVLLEGETEPVMVPRANVELIED